MRSWCSRSGFSLRPELPCRPSFHLGGTGVIVSPEGLILTQAHVVGNDAKAGQKFWPILHKDTTAEAKLLGTDLIHDLAALQLVKPGRYPFIPLADRNPVAGEGVLKLGYPAPLWFQRGRPPEVRFGKVLATTAYTFLVDCRINGGDSGGPFVSLDGHLVGILKVSTPLADESLPAGIRPVRTRRRHSDTSANPPGRRR